MSINIYLNRPFYDFFQHFLYLNTRRYITITSTNFTANTSLFTERSRCEIPNVHSNEFATRFLTNIDIF